MATCSEFIGPVIPIEQKPAIPLIDPSNLKTELKPELVDVPAVSSWDRPGHLSLYLFKFFSLKIIF